MVDTIKFSEMIDGGDLGIDDKTPGLLDGGNVLFNNPLPFLSPGTTAERPAPSSSMYYRLRFNTTTQLYEYYSPVAVAWIELEANTSILPLLASHAAGEGASLIGLENQSGVTDKTVQDLANAPLIAQTDNGTLVNGQFLSPLFNGFVTVTNGTGVLDSHTISGTEDQIDVTNNDGSGDQVHSLSSTLDFPGTFTVQGSTVIDEIIDDDTMASATDSNLSTSEAIKAYVDAQVIGGSTTIEGTANQVLANGTSGTPESGAVVLSTPQDIAPTSSPTFADLTLSSPLPISSGGTGVDAVPTAIFPSAFAAWDANFNLPANNFLEGYNTTVTSGGNTIIVVSSPFNQYFTGTSTQTVIMPDVTTLDLGQSWRLVNNSTNSLTVVSSGLNTIFTMPPATAALLTCIAVTGTTAASWDYQNTSRTIGVQSLTGTANQVIASASTGAVTLSLPQSIATSSNVTFGSVAFSSTSGIIGTTTNNNAAPGSVGEVISASVTAVAIVNNTDTDVCSIVLTPGDWDVYGSITTNPDPGVTTQIALSCGIGTTSVTFIDGAYSSLSGISTTDDLGMPAPSVRVTVANATTKTVYLVGNVVYSISTLTIDGELWARRAR